MAKLEWNYIIRLGFLDSSRPEIDFVQMEYPTDEIVEKIAVLNKADTAQIIKKAIIKGDK